MVYKKALVIFLQELFYILDISSTHLNIPLDNGTSQSDTAWLYRSK
jgi:hypothetical protein